MTHVNDRIPALLAGELESSVAEQVRAHLADCPECRQEEAAARALWEQLGAVAAPPGAADSNVWPAVRRRTFGRQAGWPLPGAGPWRRYGLAGLALAAGLGLAVLLPGSGQPAGERAPVNTDEAGTLGGSFWLEDSAGTSVSEMWLAVATGGDGS